jgi:hypothetical protein
MYRFRCSRDLASACVHHVRVRDYQNFAVNKIGLLRIEGRRSIVP